jgi:hypothetical protein
MNKEYPVRPERPDIKIESVSFQWKYPSTEVVRMLLIHSIYILI